MGTNRRLCGYGTDTGRFIVDPLLSIFDSLVRGRVRNGILVQAWEEFFMSCIMQESTRLLSVYGKIDGDDGGRPVSQYLQYRFGKPGAIELQYPEQREDSLDKFEVIND
jgi:hypothetical protein